MVPYPSLLTDINNCPLWQMQYLSWPDHGTPSDTVEFVEFVESVRDFREKSATVAPTIVHCR